VTSAIATMRERFKQGLVGRCTTAQGTFDVVQSEMWTFGAAGNGSIESRSVFSGAKTEQFYWLRAGECRVRLRLKPESLIGEVGQWDEVAYEFRQIQHDAASEVVLGEEGIEGFWLSIAPLRFVGP
jgi:hypothetical protein